MREKVSVSEKCLRVGVTGGIGSGKSLVCKILQWLGVPVYYADIRAKQLIEYDRDLRQQLINAFGNETFLPNGAYNKAYMARLVFNHPEKLQQLNEIVHPAVERDSLLWHDTFVRTARFPYTVKEAALLVETGNHQKLDFLVVVTAPEALRVARVVQRDGISEEEVRKRMAAQLPDVEKIIWADAVIENDGRHLLIPQVVTLHRRLSTAAGTVSV